jgi:hypothetical protein
MWTFRWNDRVTTFTTKSIAFSKFCVTVSAVSRQVQSVLSLSSPKSFLQLFILRLRYVSSKIDMDKAIEELVGVASHP